MLGDELGSLGHARDIVTSLDEIIGNDRNWSDDDSANDLEVCYSSLYTVEPNPIMLVLPSKSSSNKNASNDAT